MKQTLYDVLEVSPNASLAVIRAAYKSLVQRFHPDKNPDNPDAENQLKLINHAYETLSDPSSRLAYDAMLAMEEMPPVEAVQAEEAAQQEKRPVDKKILYGIGVAVLVLISAVGLFAWKKKPAPVQSAAKASRPPAPVSMPQPVPLPLPEPVTPPLPAPVERPAPLPSPVHKPVQKPVQKPVTKPVQKPVPEPVQKPASSPVTRPAAPQAVEQAAKYADLASAVSSGDVASVKSMLEGGWDPNQVRGNQVPLIIAVKNDDVRMASLLIRHGADVNLTDNQGNTAMIYAKVRADAKMIEMLKNAGAKNPFD